MTKIPADFSVRERVINPQNSFAVSAPAGSGKTALLTLRVLKLLAISDYPEQILCITFTNKAAEEMRERIYNALRDTTKNIDLDELTSYDKERIILAQAVAKRSEDRNWNILENPYRLKIMTIDGFCRFVVNQLPVNSQFGGDAGILESSQNVYEEAALDYFLHEPEKNKNLAILFNHFAGNLDRAVTLFSELLQQRDQWLPLVYGNRTESLDLRSKLENNINIWRSHLLRQLNPFFKTIESDLITLLEYAQQNLARSNPDALIAKAAIRSGTLGESDNDVANFWLPCCALLLTNTGSVRRKLTVNEGFPSQQQSDDKTLAKAMKSLFAETAETLNAYPQNLRLLNLLKIVSDCHYSDTQWQVLNALFEELPKAVAHLTLKFQTLGQVDFVEIAQGALLALQGDTEIADVSLRLESQIKHILIDEFQDTSATQLSLLKTLTEHWTGDDGRTLYVVGDGMQSCYGFRNANVGIFLNLRQTGINRIDTQASDLTVNFRSTANIIEWVNHHFTLAFPPHDQISDGAVSYSASEAFKDREDEKHSHVETLIYTHREHEARAITERIKEIRSAYPDNSIAVLVKSRSHLNELISALRDQHVPYSGLEIDALAKRELILDLTSLLRCLISIGDKVAWTALLRAPWCALDLGALTQLIKFIPRIPNSSEAINAKKNNSPSIWENIQRIEEIEDFPESALQRVITLREVMSLAMSFKFRLPLAEIVEKVWMLLGGAMLLESGPEISDIETFFKLVAVYEKAGTIANWEAFESALDKLYAEPAASTDNPVQLMTMHKSKGLEFDTVFLPALDKTPRSDQPPLLDWQEFIDEKGENRILFSPIARAGTKESEGVTQIIREQKKYQRQLEETRLFYVACTRAKTRLYLSAALTPKDDCEPFSLDNCAPSKSALLSHVWQTLKSEAKFFDDKNNPNELDVNANPANEISRSRALIELDENWRTAFADKSFYRQLNDFTYRETHPQNVDLDVFSEFEDLTRFERIRGSFIHAVFQSAALTGTLPDLNHAETSATSFWEHTLIELGLYDHSDRTRLLAQVTELLFKLESSTHVKWLIKPRDTAFCEWKLYSHDGTANIIDRAFIEGTTLWIIDYKSTEQIDSDNSLAAFYLAQKQQYKPQLDRYYQCILTNRSKFQWGNTISTVKTALYFPVIDELQEIDTFSVA